MKRLLVLLTCALLVSPACALTPGNDDVFVRVADTGAALCCIVKMPGDKYMIYDAGNYAGGGSRAAEKIQEIIPAGKTIELLVLSHSDSDHLGAVDEICDTYKVKRVLRSGHRRTTGTWTTADQAIRAEKQQDGCIDINLSYFEYPQGAMYRFGDVFVQMACGFEKPPASWGLTGQAEKRNAGSIVVRLIYKKKSILFCGDTVGRHDGQQQDVSIAAEKHMIGNSEVIKIDSDVMIAPHHGGDNGSSTAFNKAVSPKFVVFSAGHKYKHPRAKTAARYIDAKVEKKNMFRTDLKDDEGAEEWSMGRQQGHHDQPGDDDVDVVLRENGTVEVEYRDAANQQHHNTVAEP